MYKNKCKWCNKNIEVEKQCLFPIHMINCDANPNKNLRIEKQRKMFSGIEKAKRIELLQTCPNCGEIFKIRIKEALFKKNKYKKYCSRKCANSRIWSDEHNEKLSNTCKNSKKVKIANEINIKKLKESGHYRGSGKHNIEYDIKFICQYCGKIGYEQGNNEKRKYHNKCWQKISGGIRRGSSRGKSGWYKGYWCDSSYELAYLIYCLDNQISIERNTKGYEYFWKKKKHLYYPDFRVNGGLVEIKNYKSELTNVKLKSVDEKITIYYKDTIKPFLEYAIKKHGKNFIKIYEKHIPL